MNTIQKGHGELMLLSGKVLRGELTIYAEGWIEIIAIDAAANEANPKARWLPVSQCAQITWDKDLAPRQAPRLA